MEDVPAAFILAWNRHDMAALAALFAEDADFVNVVGAWWRSRAEIGAAHVATHATIFKESRLEGEVAEITRLGPGVAALHVAWTLDGLRGPDGTPAEPRQGILLLVLTEATDGWRIRIAQNTDIVPGALAPPP
ncbi:SgcJ/EcaC family oxidoreductase [Inquilinus sp.]|uniref:SgcJ/EcaC family oxidoreductase n=1 Tax=Inquilinus sp. TaxID=1932117 RepID=UPI0031DE6143